jgi:hypothetical protein
MRATTRSEDVAQHSAKLGIVFHDDPGRYDAEGVSTHPSPGWVGHVAAIEPPRTMGESARVMPKWKGRLFCTIVANHRVRSGSLPGTTGRNSR